MGGDEGGEVRCEFIEIEKFNHKPWMTNKLEIDIKLMTFTFPI